MKKIACLLALLWASGLSGLADGFIIVHDPPPWPGPGPWPGPMPHPAPPGWRPLPPPRPYPFAPLEVTYHHVTVHVTDQVAVTTVDQEFYNPNERQMEGTYIFPIPPGAQIDRFTMEIGGKEVAAELLAANKARQIYEDIVRRMKDPALLEYAGRDVFKMRIFPLEPRRGKRVKLSYTQILKADNGMVSYVYPLNTEKFSAKPIPSVSLKLELKTKGALKTLYSPSHTVEISRHGEHQGTVGFEAKNVQPNTDLQVLYSVDPGDVGVNVMTYRTGGEDGYFLLLATPSFNLDAKQVVPKDVAFVLDTSGSMSGAKIAQAKKALQFCVENLNDDDRFEILRFSTETEPLFNQLASATAENRQRASDFIKGLKAIGGTAIDDALAKSLGLRPAQSHRPFIIIFLTDGRPTVGETDEDRIVAHVQELERQGGNSRIFCFGIGFDVNTHLLDKIAEVTKAFSQYVLPEEDLEVKLSTFYTKIKEPVLTNLRLTFPEGIRTAKLYPSPLPDLFKGEQLIVAGRYTGTGTGKVVVEGNANGQDRHYTFAAQFPAQASAYDFIPRLWATRRIGYLLDEIRLHGENSELKDEVTELARRYSVVTPYTAYLIQEDEIQRNVPLSVRLGDGSVSLPYNFHQRSSEAWQLMQQGRGGGDALAASRFGLALKQANAPTEAIRQGNAELSRAPALAGITGGAPVPTAPAGGLAAPAAGLVPSQSATDLAASLPRSQFVGGRSFYQNGNQWIEAAVPKATKAQRVRIPFASEAYFKLAADQPQVLPWLAVGQNVQFMLGDRIYEIYEAP